MPPPRPPTLPSLAAFASPPLALSAHLLQWLMLAVQVGQTLRDQVFLGLLSTHDQPIADVEVLINDMTNAGIVVSYFRGRLVMLSVDHIM